MTFQRKNFLVLYLPFFFFQINSFAQSSVNKKLDSLIKVNTLRSFNGAIAIAQRGKIKYSKSYGYANLNKKTPIKLTNQFIIGSVSKQITAVLVLREVENGRLNLNQSIRHYLTNAMESWSDSVTIQQLLTHTSGISQWEKRLNSIPGTKFSYSNINYSILAQVIEKTSGRSYTDLASQLFKECKMKQSTAATSENTSNIKNVVKGYEENENGNITEETEILSLLKLAVMTTPAAGIVSTAKDLSKWNYSLHNGKLLTDSTYKLMTTIYAPRSQSWGEVGYGYGIQIDNFDNLFELSHNGRIPGFICTVIYYPETGISVVALQNLVRNSKNGPGAFYIHDQIRQIIRAEIMNLRSK